MGIAARECFARGLQTFVFVCARLFCFSTAPHVLHRNYIRRFPMILIANGRLITRDGANPYIENGGVAVSGTKIVETGETAALRAKYPDAEFVDARGGVIMPAFINAHSHIYSALARGLAMKGHNPTNFYEVTS